MLAAQEAGMFGDVGDSYERSYNETQNTPAGTYGPDYSGGFDFSSI